MLWAGDRTNTNVETQSNPNTLLKHTQQRGVLSPSSSSVLFAPWTAGVSDSVRSQAPKVVSKPIKSHAPCGKLTAAPNHLSINNLTIKVQTSTNPQMHRLKETKNYSSNKGNQELQFPTQYTVALDGSNLILNIAIKFHRGYLTRQPIAKVRVQKWHMMNVMNTSQALALQIQMIGSFAKAFSSYKGYTDMIVQMMTAFQQWITNQ